MAVISGTAGSVFVGGTAGTAVGLCSEWSGDFEMAVTQVLRFGDTWDEAIPSIHSGTGTIVLSTDTADAMQGQLETAFANGTTLDLILGAGVKTYAGTAYITGHSPTITADAKADTSFAFRTTGNWTYT